MYPQLISFPSACQEWFITQTQTSHFCAREVKHNLAMETEISKSTLHGTVNHRPKKHFFALLSIFNPFGRRLHLMSWDACPPQDAQTLTSLLQEWEEGSLRGRFNWNAMECHWLSLSMFFWWPPAPEPFKSWFCVFSEVLVQSSLKVANIMCFWEYREQYVWYSCGCS